MYIDGFKVEKESDEKSDEELDDHDEIDTTDINNLEREESTVRRENQ